MRCPRCRVPVPLPASWSSGDCPHPLTSMSILHLYPSIPYVICICHNDDTNITFITNITYITYMWWTVTNFIHWESFLGLSVCLSIIYLHSCIGCHWYRVHQLFLPSFRRGLSSRCNSHQACPACSYIVHCNAPSMLEYTITSNHKTGVSKKFISTAFNIAWINQHVLDDTKAELTPRHIGYLSHGY